jgi:hypothetical protein
VIFWVQVADQEQQAPATAHTPAPVQHGTEGADRSATGAGTGFDARMAAGALQVQRFLHLGGNAPLGDFFDHASMASIGGRKSPESTFVKGKWEHWKGQHVDPKVQKWNTAHPTHQRKPEEKPDDFKQLNENVVALHTRIISTDIHDLADEAKALSNTQLQNFLDTLENDTDFKRSKEAIGRLLVALPAAKRKFAIGATAWADGTYDWANDPGKMALVVAMLRERSPSERVLILTSQTDYVRQAVAMRDATLTPGQAIGNADATTVYSIGYATLFGSNALSSDTRDWQHMSDRWNRLGSGTQLAVLKEFFKADHVQASSINTLILANAEQRLAVLPDFVARCVDSGKKLWEGWPEGTAPWVNEFRALLSADDRLKVDHSLGQNNAALATALKIPLVAPPVAPMTTQAPGFTSPFQETKAVARPDIHHDHGFLDDGKGGIDPKKHEDPTLGDRGNKLAWEARVLAAARIKPELADATRAYKHFLIDNNGADLPFSYDHYAQTDDSGKKTVDWALSTAQTAAEYFSDQHGGGDETFKMQTGGLGCGTSSTERPYPATENWQKAIGAHSIWLEATVKVTNTGGHREIKVDLVLHAEDRYNFNPGSADIATNTLDADNGRFEITGLGKEFMSVSTLRRSATSIQPAVARPNGSRHH